MEYIIGLTGASVIGFGIYLIRKKLAREEENEEMCPICL